MKFSSQFRKYNFRVSPRRVIALIKEKHGSEQEEGSLTVFQRKNIFTQGNNVSNKNKHWNFQWYFPHNEHIMCTNISQALACIPLAWRIHRGNTVFDSTDLRWGSSPHAMLTLLVQLSLWRNLGSPRRQASRHICHGLFW